MDTSHISISRLEDRVRRLERTNRLLVLGALALVTVAWVTGERTPGHFDEITAERVRVVDGEGQTRIDLRHDSDETGMFILDDAGDTRLGAAQFAHGGGGYALHGPGGRGAAVLYLRGDGSLTIYDADGGIVDRFPGEAP